MPIISFVSWIII